MDAADHHRFGKKAPRPASERPCYQLTVELLSTYKHINEKFYESKRKRTAVETGEQLHNGGYDDDQGNYRVQTGEEIAGRYIVQEVLGKGSFGVVCKAHDHRKDEAVAIKIIKNKVQFFHQAKVEIEILTKLNAAAGEEHNIVKLKKVFSWKDHLCLVFELLSFNLYDLLKYTKFGGVSLNLVRKFAFQILKTLDFLAQPNMGVIHCDLKPENILLKNPKRSGIKVIDFGSSCHVNKRMFKYIQSRFYRSPEVILGLSYDCAIDMWSLACILVEMHTGHPLFDGKDEFEQLLKMGAVLQPPPSRMVEASPKRTKFFVFNAATKKWDFRKENTFKRRTLEDILGMTAGGGGPGGRRKGQAGHSEQDYLNFVDLLKKMLSYSPTSRMLPSAALQHPFLTPVVEQDMSHIASPLKPPAPLNDLAMSYIAPTSAAALYRDRSRSRERSRDLGLERRDSRLAATSSATLSQPLQRAEREGRAAERRPSLSTTAHATNAYGSAIRSSSHSQRGSALTLTGGSARARSSSIASNTGSATGHFQTSATRSSSHTSLHPTDLHRDLQRLQEHQEVLFPYGRTGAAASPSSTMRGHSPTTSPGGLRLKPKQPGGTSHVDPLGLASPKSTFGDSRKYASNSGAPLPGGHVGRTLSKPLFNAGDTASAAYGSDERKLLALSSTPEIASPRDRGLSRLTSPQHKVASPSLDHYLERHSKLAQSPDSGSWASRFTTGLAASPASYVDPYAASRAAHPHGGAEPMSSALDADWP